MSVLADAGHVLRSWNSDACKLLSGGQPSVRGGLVFNRALGVFLPPDDAAFVQPQRRWTWEDTLRASDLRLRGGHLKYFFNTTARKTEAMIMPSDLDKLEEPRNSHHCRRRWHCDALGLPLAIHTAQRPVKAFLAQPAGARRLYLALPIEKAGLSSLDAFFKDAE